MTTGVGVLDRTVAILDAVERTPMGASELARHLGLSVPTTHRLVAAMVTHGLLRRDGSGRHHTGWRFVSSALAAAAGPVMEDLREETGESAQVWVQRGEQRLCLVSVESDAELRASLPVGSMLALSAGGSAARALTESAPEEPQWFESVSQRTPGLCSVSAPVRLHGDVVAAVGVSAPVSRVQAEGPGAQFGGAVLAAVDRLEAVLQAG
ncbi:IclR family transcriptional regulator [Salinifilum aidingensis]